MPSPFPLPAALCAVLLFFLPAAAPAAPNASAAEALERAIQRGLEESAAGSYARALATFGKIAEQNPARPEGPFFRAAVYQILLGHFERPAYQAGFKENSALAVSRSESLIRRNPGDAKGHLFLGLSGGMIAVEASKKRHYITAFRYGQKLSASMERALELDPALEDAYYGLGLYHYWRSRIPVLRAVSKTLRRAGEQGMAYLRRAAERGRWLKNLARIELVWALYQEKRFAEARKALAPLIARYPGQPFYVFARAEGYFRERKFARARREYAAIWYDFRNRDDDLASLYRDFAEWRVVRSNYELGHLVEAERGARRVAAKPDRGSPLLRRVRAAAAHLRDSLAGEDFAEDSPPRSRAGRKGAAKEK